VELRQLRYALAVAKERSFTRAAARLNVSQSAVSEQVSLLENEIGFSVFRRSSRGVELTERGRSFLYDAERVMGDVLSLSDTARRLRGAPSETLTIGMGSGMAQIFIPRLFGNLSARLPDVRLEILTAPTKSIFSDLHEERLDAGIAIEPGVSPHDVQRRAFGSLQFEHRLCFAAETTQFHVGDKTLASFALEVEPHHIAALQSSPVGAGQCGGLVGCHALNVDQRQGVDRE